MRNTSETETDEPARFPKFHLIDHLFIIRALILRELRLKHQKMGRVGFWVEFIMPIVIMVMHYYIFLALARQMPAGIPVELFVLGAFPAWFAFRNTTAKLLHRRDEALIPGVTSIDLLVAPAVWECVAMAFIMYVGLSFSELTLGNERLPNVPITILVFVVATALGTGYRLFFDALGYIWPLAKSIKKPLTWMLFLTSGIYYGAQSTKPNILVTVSWYNPLIHIIESMRQALWPGYPVARVNLLYPIAWALGLMLLGLIMHERLSRLANK